jgi:hypothetical protein
MPPRFELDCMGLDDPRDLRQLPPIVSRALVEPGAGEPELRVSTVALDVDMRWLAAVDRAESKRVSGFVMERGHAGMLVADGYRPLTIGLRVGGAIKAFAWRGSGGCDNAHA